MTALLPWNHPYVATRIKLTRIVSSLLSKTVKIVSTVSRNFVKIKMLNSDLEIEALGPSLWNDAHAATRIKLTSRVSLAIMSWKITNSLRFCRLCQISEKKISKTSSHHVLSYFFSLDLKKFYVLPT